MVMPVVQKLEERWTPTTIQAAFVFHSPNSTSSISVDFPLLNLGWTFTLSLTPKALGACRSDLKRRSTNKCYWIPKAFSFHRHGSIIPSSWRNTSMHAQLSLATEQHDHDSAPSCSGECTPPNTTGVNLTPLGTMEVSLADTPSVKVPSVASCPLSLLQPTKVWLTVTISECPFADGLFQAASGQAEAEAQLVRKSGDRVLSRSLVTGKLFDVKFLTSPTRSTSGNTGKLLLTYASLSVLEEHVNLSSAKLKEGWTSALAAMNCCDNAEILCPNDYDYELDSDYEDEDEVSSPVKLCASSPPHERNVATLEGQQLDGSTESSSSSLSSFELEGVSDQGSVDYQSEEVIKGPGESPHLFSAAAADYEPAVLIKFAAHRTWYAFLWYCYTGRLEFSKLKSQVEPGARHLRVIHLEDGPPSCSPKSMYRLADLVDDKVLKAKALAAIKERMTEVNILDEMFSVFTSKYPDVREVQLDVFMEHRGSPEVKTAFLRAMSKFGSMPHAEPVLSAFYDKLTV